MGISSSQDATVRFTDLPWIHHRSLVTDNLQRFTQAEISHLFQHRARNRFPDDLQHLFIDEQHFQNLEEIGRGHFGTVYRAMFDGSTPVALKTFPSSSNETFEEFVHEVTMMKEFNQTNLLAILGITFLRSTSQLGLVTELMFNGSLLDYLRKHREEYRQSKSPHNIRHELNRFARQIFLAMIYLEEKFIVHRDLAARNCLVDHHQQLKIADFGLSKLTDSGLYKGNQRTLCPLRWSAPEAIFCAKYSSRSDLWSYGITLWEIYSLAERPFARWSNASVRLLLKNVNINLKDYLPRPSKRFQSKRIQTHLIDLCWIYPVAFRPTFKQLQQRIEQLLPLASSSSSSSRR